MIPNIFTIGHSNHSIQRFLMLLSTHSISMVVDVRSQPYSRIHPHFNRETLNTSLMKQGMLYRFAGDLLGGRSLDRACYENGRVQYGRLAATECFQTGLEQVLTESRVHRIALMCAEREPLECHRSLLVARALTAAGAEVGHIHSDGHPESHLDAVNRLVAMLVGWPEQEDLFRTRSQVEEEAYARQAARVAYFDESLAAAPDQAWA